MILAIAIGIDHLGPMQRGSTARTEGIIEVAFVEDAGDGRLEARDWKLAIGGKPLRQGAEQALGARRKTQDARRRTQDAGQNIGTSEPRHTGTSTILAEIRLRIERAKAYPPAARREGIEGRPEVEFALNPDGTVQSARVIGSSGEPALDSAAVATVHRGAPFPYYPGTIRLAIRFQLE